MGEKLDPESLRRVMARYWPLRNGLLAHASPFPQKTTVWKH